MTIRELQPVTLMVYIGPEKVWTPGHKDICGSLGHNIMVYAEPQAYSMWFCIGRRKYYMYIQALFEKNFSFGLDCCNLY